MQVAEGSPYLPSGESSPLLNQIRQTGGALPVFGPDIPIQDLALASRASGNEIALYQDLRSGQHFLTEGSSVTVEVPINSKLILHVQPGDSILSIQPSVLDRQALGILGQDSSIIINSAGTLMIRFGTTNALDGEIEEIRG